MPGSSLQIGSVLATLLGQVKARTPAELHRFWWLWVGLFFVAVMLVAVVWAISRRHRNALAASERPNRPRAIKDAWAEAGKRAEPIPEEPLGDADEGDQ